VPVVWRPLASDFVLLGFQICINTAIHALDMALGVIRRRV